MFNLPFWEVLFGNLIPENPRALYLKEIKNLLIWAKKRIHEFPRVISSLTTTTTTRYPFFR